MHASRLIVSGAFSALILCACGGGAPVEVNGVSSSPGGSVGLTISGTATTSVDVGATYQFVPAASDVSGKALTFTIANKPNWATFDSATGALSGSPDAGDAGTYTSISISVSDGSGTASLASFSVVVKAPVSTSATVNWTPPSENTDGSVPASLAGYHLYYGLSAASLDHTIDIGSGLTSYQIDGLTSGLWFFGMTSFTSAGEESTISNIGVKLIISP